MQNNNTEKNSTGPNIAAESDARMADERQQQWLAAFCATDKAHKDHELRLERRRREIFLTGRMRTFGSSRWL